MVNPSGPFCPWPKARESAFSRGAPVADVAAAQPSLAAGVVQAWAGLKEQVLPLAPGAWERIMFEAHHAQVALSKPVSGGC